MAVVPSTSKNALGQIVVSSVLLATSGDTLVYVSGAGQTLHLTNTEVSSLVVTIDGSGGTTIVIPGTGGATASVASGVAYTVAAGATSVIRLDTISAYCQGTVSISAGTGAKVIAYITV